MGWESANLVECVDLCVWLVCAYKAQEVHFSFSVMDLGARHSVCSP